MIDLSKAPSEDPVVFFVHIMKTGGTPVVQIRVPQYPKGSRYPEEGEDEMFIAAKGLTENLFGLSEERRLSLRWISPHMPLSAAIKFREAADRPVYITLVLRDGFDRALSHLRNVSRRFNHTYTYRQLLDNPVLRDFFFSNHQTRALSMGESCWQEWDQSIKALTLMTLGLEQAQLAPDIAPVGPEDLEQAIDSLRHVDVLGRQSEFDNWWQRCSSQFGWPAVPAPPVNVTSKLETGTAPPIPDSVLEEIRELNALDSRLYAAADELLKQGQATR
jgi:hypothetical protein